MIAKQQMYSPRSLSVICKNNAVDELNPANLLMLQHQDAGTSMNVIRGPAAQLKRIKRPVAIAVKTRADQRQDELPFMNIVSGNAPSGKGICRNTNDTLCRQWLQVAGQRFRQAGNVSFRENNLSGRSEYRASNDRHA